jgi:hypothetical protein
LVAKGRPEAQELGIVLGEEVIEGVRREVGAPKLHKVMRRMPLVGRPGTEAGDTEPAAIEVELTEPRR